MDKFYLRSIKNTIFPSKPSKAIRLLLMVLFVSSFANVASGQTNTWDGSNSNNWNTAANWSLNLVPSAAHDIVINTNAAILVDVNATINSLTISGGATVSFTSSGAARMITIDDTGSSVGVGSRLTLQGSTGSGTRSMTIAYSGTNRTMSIAGTLALTNVGEGTIYTATNSITTVTGTIINTGTLGVINSTTANLVFASGGTYRHELDGGTIPTATWNANSNCNIIGLINTQPSGDGQAFGNLIYNCSGMNTGIDMATSGLSIAGNFQVLNTGSGQLRMLQTPLTVSGNCTISDNFRIASGTSRTLNVNGDFTLNGSSLDMCSGGNGDSGTLNVTGNFALSGGTISESGSGTSLGAIVFNKSGTQTYTSGGTVSSTINFTVNSGSTLQMASPTTVVTGNSFVLSSGAALGITSTTGITSSGSTGNIQTTTRTFNTGASYIYNGSTAQAAGNGLPATVSNLTISNSAGATLAQATTVTNNFSITTGAIANLGTGLTHTAGLLTLGGEGTVPGSWGSTTSSATNQNNTYFAATTGRVNNNCTAPAITTQPTALTICENTGGSFNVGTSASTPTYQWQYSADNINWTNIDASLAPYVSGYTTATFTLSNTPASWTNNYVRCAVWSSGGCRTNSNSVLLTVSSTLSAPTIGTITQPTCLTATGSVVLNGLPTGSWVLTRTPGSVTTTGTGTSTTISGLAAGTTYTYSVNGLSNGLKGEYYNNMTLTGSPVLTRTDATVNFNWGGANPDTSINSDGFSVRWSGQIQPLYSQMYTFSTLSDDGIRLWVNGVQIINNWTNHSAATDTGTISLVAGVKYNIVLEFFENSGDAVSTLSWSSPSQTSQIISTTQLFPVGSCASPASANVVINAQPATPAAPTGTASQSFCSSSNPTVASLAATGTALKWYAASSGGSALATTTALVNGTHYFATQTVTGCESTSRFDVTVTVINPAVPTGTAIQSFCAINNPTVANLTATGTAIQWYAVSSGGSPLPTTTALVNGTHYYATQTVSSCESTTRFDVTATITASPTITGTVTPATCSNGSDGAITITGLNVPIEFKNADNDYIDLGSSFLSNKSAFTVEGWVKFNLADVGSRMSLFGQNDIIEFYLNTNTIELWTPNTGVITTPITAAIGNNAWHHIAATGNATSTNIYIDGVLKVTGPGAANYGTSAYNAQIGSGVVDPLTPVGGGFTGQIEKVGFYSTALSAGTITSLASSPTTYSGTETGIIAGYNFYDGLGTTLTSLPAGRNGTFGNSPQWVYTYAWTKTGTPSYTASTKNISALTPGDYNLSISTLGGGCPITKTFTVGFTNTTPSAPTVGATTQPNCVTAGSVVLSDLPASGTVNQTGTATNSYAITGTTMTISGLAAGTYNFSASNGSCSSSATGNVVINAVVINTWNGIAWDNGTPIASHSLIFNGNYPPSPDPNLDITGCSCTVNTGRNVTIKTGRNLIITSTVTISGTGTLTFENTSSLVQTNNAAINSGNIIYQRTSASALTSDYTYWSSPVASQNLSISPSYASGMFYSYNDFAIPEDWKKETSSTTMAVGKGYIIRGPQTASPPPPPGLYYATFTGVPNNGIKTIAIGSTGTSNLLGNPYPSAIDADTFLSTNSTLIEGTIYFWTHNTAIQLASNITNGTAGSGALAYTSDDYASYNGTGGAAASGGVTPTGKIAAGQAFFTTSKATGLVTFNNAMRLAGTTLTDKTGINQQFFKTKSPAITNDVIEKNRIWLNLSNKQGAFKQTLIGYVTDATNDYDSRYDGETFDGNEFVDFYSINQDKNLVIQGRALPFDQNDEVPLGFRSAIDGDFTINIDQTDGLLTNQAVFIEDKLTNTVFDLKSGNYTFKTTAGIFNDRFVLRYNSKTLGVNEIDSEDGILVLYSKNDKTVIIYNKEIDSTVNSVSLYNIVGQKIAVWDVKDREQSNIQIPIKDVSSEIYIVKVKTTKGEISKKIIVN
jgi:hypothetical protein